MALTRGPGADWLASRHAMVAVDATTLETVGPWDHLISVESDCALLSGWFAYGAFAALTRRIR
jgi:hypothetical protein